MNGYWETKYFQPTSLQMTMSFKLVIAFSLLLIQRVAALCSVSGRCGRVSLPRIVMLQSPASCVSLTLHFSNTQHRSLPYVRILQNRASRASSTEFEYPIFVCYILLCVKLLSPPVSRVPGNRHSKSGHPRDLRAGVTTQRKHQSRSNINSGLLFHAKHLSGYFRFVCVFEVNRSAFV
jgi:hypothetical protein